MTEYIVMRKVDGRWGDESVPVSARSARAAVELLANREENGEYVAIPARSFRPVKSPSPGRSKVPTSPIDRT